MKLYKHILIFLLTLLCASTYAQTVSVNVTDAACPGQGAATVVTSNIANPLFQLKNGAGVNIGTATNTNIFLALDAGNYQVQVKGEGGIDITESFAVVSTYQPIPVPTIFLEGFCDATFTMGGTLSVTMPSSPTGKTYEYKVVKTTNPNFSDTEGVYQAISTITTVPEYGTYQVRIKDECGQVITIQRDIAPALQDIQSIHFGLVNNQACDANAAEMTSIRFYSASGNTLNFDSYLALGGIRLEMWERPATGGCPTTAPESQPIFDEIIQAVDNSTGYVLPLVPSKRYVVRVTTPCGQVSVFCFSDDGASTPDMQVTTSNAGCVATGETMTIAGFENFFLNFPVTVTVINSANVQVYTSVQPTSWYLDRWKTDPLPMDNYTVTYTDQCGVQLLEDVSNINPGGIPTAPTIADIVYTKWRCFNDNSGSLTETGTTQVTLTIGGYIPNRENAVVTIISGPSNVGKTAAIYNNSQYSWTNMLPGNYTISIASGCDGEVATELTFEVSPTPNYNLQQSLVSTGNSFCTGGGSITSQIVYNGDFSNVVQLLNEEGNVLQENNSGLFTNLPPGTYYTRLHIVTCTSDTYNINNASAIVITDGATGPQIVKKIGIVCEDETGTPTSNGSAYFEIAGASPVVVQYKKQSETDWVLFNDNAPMAFEITGLEANEIYEVQVTSCGATISTTVAIQSPGSITASNTVHPCLGQPYTLSLPDYMGATYEWKNNAGAVVANSRDYHITNYTASHDGIYTATITWGGCVVRFFRVALDSEKCGEGLDEECQDTFYNPVFHLFQVDQEGGATTLRLYKQEDGIGSSFVCPDTQCEVNPLGALYKDTNIAGNVSNLAYDDGKYYVINSAGNLLYTDNIIEGVFANLGSAQVGSGFKNLAYDQGVFYRWVADGTSLVLYQSDDPVNNGWTIMGTVSGREISYSEGGENYSIRDMAVNDGVFYFMYYNSSAFDLYLDNAIRTRVLSSATPTVTGTTWENHGTTYFGYRVYNIAYGSQDLRAIAPPVLAEVDDCPELTFDLSTAHTGQVPSNTELRWYNNEFHYGSPLTTTEIANASAGTYYAFYYDILNNCYSPPASVTINECQKALIITNPILRNKVK